MAQPQAKVTPTTLRLSGASLSRLPATVQLPSYDWKSAKVGIIHVSLGAFHRAHEAVYTDDVLAKNGGDWAICGVGAMPTDHTLIDALQKQDHLYTVMTRGKADNHARVIGALRETMVMPADPATVIKRLASADIKIMSLTITEKGYCHDPQTGLLNATHPQIIHDLTTPDAPQTVIGLIVAGLKARRAAKLPPFTVLSCDNLPHNGNKTKSIVLAYAKLLDAELAGWIEHNVAFPNTMVDRITPVTQSSDKQDLQADFSYTDEGLVVCEPFRQWVLEDHFPLGRPAWEVAGAQFVQDVAPYELAKIRLLNVSHTVFAYPAWLAGFIYVADGAADPLLARYVRSVMDEEITPTLPPVPGLELESYKKTIIERFANPAIKDTWERICSDGSQKIANQLVPIVRERLAKGESADGLALLIAIWFRYLTGKQDNGTSYKLNDPMAEQLQAIALKSGQDPMPLLTIKDIFGEDLSRHQAFAERVRADLADIYAKGVVQVIAARYK